MALEDLFGWVGAFLTITFFISPIIPFINVFKGQLDYGDTPTDLIGINYSNCLVWYIYGSLLNSPQIKTSSTIGFFSSLLFMIIYLSYEIRKNIIDGVLNILIIFTGSRAAYHVLTVIFPDYYNVGKICICATIIFYIYPFNIMFRVIKEKNYKLIPFIIAIFYVLNAVCWTYYGKMKKDFYVYVPSFLGIIVGVGQNIVRYYYKKNYPIIEHVTETSTINIEATGIDNVKKTEDVTVEVDEEEGDKIKAKPVKIVTKSDSKTTV